MRGKATRNPTEVDFFYLETQADVVPCMEALITIGYESDLRATKNANGLVEWPFVVDKLNPSRDENWHQLIVGLGDVLVYDANIDRLVSMRKEEFMTRYKVKSTA